MAPDQAKLQQDAMASIASVSTLLRNALAACLPVAPEQYLTVAIPGTTIDLKDSDEGGSLVYDVGRHAQPPTTVRQSEARLVDGMMPIASVMIGSTGKSVARSYSRALNGLVPAKATISSNNGIRSPGNKSYDEAMEFLRRKEPEGRTIVEVYQQKQLAWAKARSEWDKARIEVQQKAEEKYPSSSGGDFISRQKQFVDDWNQQNHYAYKASVQAAWMDWVVNGQKYDVEYNFGLIDVDSFMGRIEASKESLRNSTIPDQDGASEVYGVSLTPRRWATYCKRKAEGWYARNGNFSLGQLDAEIARLAYLLESYSTAEEIVVKGSEGQTYPVHDAIPPQLKESEVKTTLETKMKRLYVEQGVFAGKKHNADVILSDPASTGPEKEQAKAELEAAKANVAAAEKALQDAQHDYENVRKDWDDYNRLSLGGQSRADVGSLLQSRKATIATEIDRLRGLRINKALQNPITVPVIVGATAPRDDKDKQTLHGTSIAVEGSELAAAIFQTPSAPTSTATAAGADASGGAAAAPTTDATAPLPSSAAAEDADPWTPIAFSYSASDLQNSLQSSWGAKVGGSVGYGLWSEGGSYAHDESRSSVQSAMAACDVSVSFSALVVNIARPWLYAELFSDNDLEVADGVKISPGPQRLKHMIAEQAIAEIELYTQFPAYPTSFIVAADTTIEFRGATKRIEDYFVSNSTSAVAQLGWGPWTAQTGATEDPSSQRTDSVRSMQVQATATGCKLSFGAPQVVAWVSQILPALPREKAYNPLTQGAGIPVPDSNTAPVSA